MFHRTKQAASHQAGQLAIVITEIRPDDAGHRDEQDHAEEVVHYRPVGLDRDYAITRAQKIHAEFAPAARDRYRVKVVAR